MSLVVTLWWCSCDNLVVRLTGVNEMKLTNYYNYGPGTLYTAPTVITCCHSKYRYLCHTRGDLVFQDKFYLDNYKTCNDTSSTCTHTCTHTCTCMDGMFPR